jgi:hypothetical protein
MSMLNSVLPFHRHITAVYAASLSIDLDHASAAFRRS